MLPRPARIPLQSFTLLRRCTASKSSGWDYGSWASCSTTKLAGLRKTCIGNPSSCTQQRTAIPSPGTWTCGPWLGSRLSCRVRSGAGVALGGTRAYSKWHARAVACYRGLLRLMIGCNIKSRPANAQNKLARWLDRETYLVYHWQETRQKPQGLAQRLANSLR